MEDSRQALVGLMADTHRVSEDLAEYWVDQMTDAQVDEELRLRRGNLP